MEKKIVSTPKAPAAIGPYSQAVIAGGVMYLSGQIALSAETGKWVGGTVEEQTQLAMSNMKEVLGAAGLGFEHVVQCTIYLVDMDDFQAVNGVYGAFFSDAPPARATIAVAGLPKGALVEIGATAVVPS